MNIVLQQDIDQTLTKEVLIHTDMPLIVCRMVPFRILYINQALEKEWGFYTDIIMEDPHRITEVIHAEDRAAFIDKFLNNSLSYCKEPLEFRVVLPDKSQRWYSLRLYSLRIHNWVVGILENVTERKCRETALQNTHEGLQDYVRILKHDLKGTLGSIEMAAGLIRENLTAKQQEELTTYFDVINMVCHTAVSQMEELSDRFFLASENLPPEKEEVDLSEEIFQAIDLYRAQLQVKNLTTKVSLSEGSMRVVADKIKCWQIIKNLMSNAIKFSRKDGQITIALKNLKDVVLLEVSDTGIGIPASFHPFIFQKYSRAMRAGTAGENPTGMGTYIIKQMAESQGGEVWFESKEDEGTTFFVKLRKR